MNEIHFDFLNFNTILCILLILVIGGYLYYEIYKLKKIQDDINSKLNYYIDNTDHLLKGINPISETINDHLNETINETINNHSEEIREELNTELISETDMIEKQMNKYSDSQSDSHSDSRSDSQSDSQSESMISQSEIEKDYGKDDFEQENNNASIDDIISDKHIITDNSLSDILNVDSDLTKIDEFIQNIQSDKDIQKDYNDMTVSELKKVLVDMNLPVSGNKTKLIERILENKK
jgi:hypothetical protein